jgi:hypothetical protein
MSIHRIKCAARSHPVIHGLLRGFMSRAVVHRASERKNRNPVNAQSFLVRFTDKFTICHDQIARHGGALKSRRADHFCQSDAARPFATKSYCFLGSLKERSAVLLGSAEKAWCRCQVTRCELPLKREGMLPC